MYTLNCLPGEHNREPGSADENNKNEENGFDNAFYR